MATKEDVIRKDLLSQTKKGIGWLIKLHGEVFVRLFVHEFMRHHVFSLLVSHLPSGVEHELRGKLKWQRPQDKRPTPTPTFLSQRSIHSIRDTQEKGEGMS